MGATNPAQADAAQTRFTDDELLALVNDAGDVNTHTQGDLDPWMLDSDDARTGGTDFDQLLNGITGGSDLDRDHDFDFEWANGVGGNESSLWEPSTDAIFSEVDAGATASLDDVSPDLDGLATCWRCKIRREKCDPQIPCKACPQVEPGTIWQDLGCKRGTLLELSPPINLCPNSQREAARDPTQIEDSHATEQQICELLTSKLTHQRNSRRDALILTLQNSEYTLEKMRLEVYCPFVKSGNFSPVRGRLEVTHERILSIVWGIMKHPQIKTKLHIQSLEDLATLINAAAGFEKDNDGFNLVSLALETFHHCLEVLIMSSTGVLATFSHDTCFKGTCNLESLNRLTSTTSKYLEQLSLVLLRGKTLPNEKRWWLSCLYSFYIHSFVRLGLIEVEKLLMACNILPESTTPKAEEHCQLAVRLFTAASDGYDPLSSDWTLEEPPETLLSDIKLLPHLSDARKMLKEGRLGYSGVRSSYRLLGLLFDLNTTTYRRLSLKPQGKRRREDSPPEPLLTSNIPSERGYDMQLSTISQIAELSHSRDHSPPPPLPPPRFIPRGAGLGFQDKDRDEGYSDLRRDGAYPSTRRFSRNTSPVSRTSMDHPGNSGHASRNRSPDSLSGLPESVNRWTGVAAGSPASIYSMSPTGLSPHFPLSRRTSGTLAMRRPSRRSDDVTRASITTFREGLVICECCPKKPKKFKNVEALKKHEAEKSNECSFCGTRFKNKNEMDRHINSLHVRRHSWSCSALSGFQVAFIESTVQAGQQDDCGYCGESFPRTGWLDNLQMKCATDADWGQRISHLQTVHKFGECNLAKRFYRADHFRQHLKHSHSGTMGKWTNILENKCMLEEDPIPR